MSCKLSRFEMSSPKMCAFEYSTKVHKIVVSVILSMLISGGKFVQLSIQISNFHFHFLTIYAISFVNKKNEKYFSLFLNFFFFYLQSKPKRFVASAINSVFSGRWEMSSGLYRHIWVRLLINIIWYAINFMLWLCVVKMHTHTPHCALISYWQKYHNIKYVKYYRVCLIWVCTDGNRLFVCIYIFFFFV